MSITEAGFNSKRYWVLALAIMLFMLCGLHSAYSIGEFKCNISNALESTMASGQCSWNWGVDSLGARDMSDQVSLIKLSKGPSANLSCYNESDTTPYVKILNGSSVTGNWLFETNISPSSASDVSYTLYFNFLRPNVTSNTVCQGEYVLYNNRRGWLSVTASATIYDKYSALTILTDVSPYNNTGLSVGVTPYVEKVITNRKFVFTVNSTVPTLCNYHHLTSLSQNLSEFNYITASVNSSNNLENGSLDGSGLVHTRILEYTQDAVDLRYGFYCIDGSGIEGRDELIFTIDTTPPEVIYDVTSRPVVNFMDSQSHAFGQGQIFGNGLVINSSSRDISMFFSTNEQANCRYDFGTSNASIQAYDSLAFPIDMDAEASLSHNISMQMPIGRSLYYYIGCKDKYGNKDNESQVQTILSNSTNRTAIMFLMQDPSCTSVNLTAADVPNDQGGAIALSWNRANQDGLNNDYITTYAIYRISNASNTSHNDLVRNDLYEMNTTTYPTLKNIVNLTADDSVHYAFNDTYNITEHVNYTYYILPFYQDESPEVMANIRQNMSCSAVSNMINASDNLGPAPVTGLSAVLALGLVNGSELRLIWNLSADDNLTGNHDVTNYTVFRAVYGTMDEILGRYATLASNLSPGTSLYDDSTVNPFTTYCYYVMGTDKANQSTNSTRFCTKPNSMPVLLNISITPSNPRASDALTCTALISDYDGNSLQGLVNFTWHILRYDTFENQSLMKPGVCTMPANSSFQRWHFQNFTTECISDLSGLYRKGDKVWCEAQASDGIEMAKDLRTGSYYIITNYTPINNTPPYAINVQITPPAPTGSSNLLCTYSFGDYDNDAENISLAKFKWYINNEGINDFVEILGQSTKILPASFIDQNDLVVCAVRPYDIDASWIENSLPADTYENSSSVLVTDNSIPQIVNYSALPFDTPGSKVTIVGGRVIFNVGWLDTDLNEEASMYVCDSFSSPESQTNASSDADSFVHFGDNSSNHAIKAIFYSNHSGLYVSTIGIKPYEIVRSDKHVFAAGTRVQTGDFDVGAVLTSFPGNYSFYDADYSGAYTAGEPIVEEASTDLVYEPNIDLLISGPAPPYLATLTNLSVNNQTFLNNTRGKFNASIGYVYHSQDPSTATVTANDKRLDIVAEDNESDIYFTPPIYDMYVYEVNNKSGSIEGKTLIAKDNNLIFSLGKYNYIQPKFNAQPLPDKYLAFVLCIDSNDDAICDSNNNNANDLVYVYARANPGTHYANDTSKSSISYDPDVEINYDSQIMGKCTRKLFCDTGLSGAHSLSCLYTTQQSDNISTEYAVRVCDKMGACSIERTGTFDVDHVPLMRNVYIGSDSNSTAIGTDNNIMCMHTGALDSYLNISDIILDADSNWTIFGDVRNSRDIGLLNGSPLRIFSNGTNLTSGGELAFDKTYYQDGSNYNDTNYNPYTDALVIDNLTGGTPGRYDITDIVIYNPSGSLRLGDYLVNVTSSETNLSYYDSNGDEKYTWNSSNPEDIVYDPVGHDLTVFDEPINYTFTWFVMPKGDDHYSMATSFGWYDNDFNDILTHGNLMPGDKWICQVTPNDTYGYGMPKNSSSVTIGSSGVNPSLAPVIYNVSDNSPNSSYPVSVGGILNVTVTLLDPDSTQVKIYLCNSSRIIRNSGCYEKEYNRTIGTVAANTLSRLSVNYVVEDIYNTSDNFYYNYTVMACDPEYHCSEITSAASGQFTVNHAPQHLTGYPIVVPYPSGNTSYPRDYSANTNLLCNISYLDQDNLNWQSNVSTVINSGTVFKWYRTRASVTEKLSDWIGSLGGAVLSNSQTELGDYIFCSAMINDSRHGQSAESNSTPIEIGTYITSTDTVPVIDKVITDSTNTTPVNYGSAITFSVYWHSYSSASVNIYICNSTNVSSSGCTGRTLAYTTSAVSPAQIQYTVSESDMAYFINSTTYTPYAVNYTILVVNALGRDYSTYTDNTLITSDDFSVNYIPYVPNNLTVSGTDALTCSYTFVDNDSGLPGLTTSNYSRDHSLIAWYNQTSPGSWQEYSFPYTSNVVPASLTNRGDVWKCEVTPYDGYAYGVPVTSGQTIVGNTSPQIVRYELLHNVGTGAEALALAITQSSPVIYGEPIIVRAYWQDPDNAETMMQILNNQSYANANAFNQSIGYLASNPIELSFNSSLIASMWNATNYNNNYTGNFTFILSDANGNYSSWPSVTTVFMDRQPQIESPVVVDYYSSSALGYFQCLANASDNDSLYNYNAANITYQWYIDSGLGYALNPAYTNNSMIPVSLISLGQKVKCEATPCDAYACGRPVMSSNYLTSSNETPQVATVFLYNINTSESGTNYVLNSISAPVKYRDQMLFNITWDDSELHGFSEVGRIYVCSAANPSTTPLGCVNATELCRTTSATTTASCILDTSAVNITLFNQSIVNYSVVIYDKSDRKSTVYNSTFRIDQPPYVINATVTPRNPTSDDVLTCNYNITDNDTFSGYNGSNSTPAIAWYLYRLGITSKTQYTQANVTPDVTEKLDKWLCQVTPVNGTTVGVPFNSSWVTIGNAVPYSDRPNITSITVDSNNTHPTVVGMPITFTINWTDAQLPSEVIHVIICNSSGIVNDTGCANRSFVNLMGVASEPATVTYTTSARDTQSVGSNNSFYAMICDDSSLCSAIYIVSSPSFYVINKPTVPNVAVIGTDSLNCSYNFSFGANSPIGYNLTWSNTSSIVSWYTKSASSGGDWSSYNGITVNNGSGIPAYATANGSMWKCTVEPYDGYLHGDSVASSAVVVGVNATPVITSVISQHTNGSQITNISPVQYGSDIVLSVSWYDSDNSTIKVFLTDRNSNMQSAVVYYESAGYVSTNPLAITIPSTALTNISNYPNNTNLSNFLYLRLYDGVQYSGLEVPNVFVNRLPAISGSISVSNYNASGSGYYSCDANTADNDTNDTSSGYNTISLRYAWYNRSMDGTYAKTSYNSSILLHSQMHAGERWFCEATPCDQFSCGASVSYSPYFTLMNESPSLLSKSVTSGGSLVSVTLPVRFGDMVSFSITWDDSELYTGGETARIYVCANNSSTKDGCVNTTEWCRTTASSSEASCTLNTSGVNMTRFSDGTVNYTINIYDNGNRVYASPIYTFNIDQAPYVINATVTPRNPTSDDVLTCNYNITDNDTFSGYNGSNSTPAIAWYLLRSGVVSSTLYKQATLTPDVTEKLDKWLCQVTPVNGTTVGAPFNSSWVTVGNAVPYSDRPNITSILINNNQTHPTNVGDNVLVSISWADAQLPDESIHIIICNSSRIINGTGCLDKAYVNINSTTAEPAVVHFMVNDSDTVNSSVNYGRFYTMVCDDSGLCSDIYDANASENTSNESARFYINHKPTVSSVNVSRQQVTGNLQCNYQFADNSSDYYNISSDTAVSWYKADISLDYCGDGILSSDPNREDCDAGIMRNSGVTCNSINPAYLPGQGYVTCDLSTCKYNTKMCWTETMHCGDGSINGVNEQCDTLDFGGRTCNSIGTFTGGIIVCNPDCTLNVSGCTGGSSGMCGNRVLEFGEECETSGGAIIGQATKCSDFPDYIGGTLGCDSTCNYNKSLCLSSADSYTDLNVTGNVLPVYAYSDYNKIVCKVKPSDGYSYGIEVFSREYSAINETPIVTSLLIKDVGIGSTINISHPILYGRNAELDMTWDDFDWYKSASENVKLFVCTTPNATYQGCIGTQLCKIPMTNQRSVNCTFDTDNLTITDAAYGNNVTFYVFAYDDSLKYSVLNTSVYVDRLPTIANYSIVTTSGVQALVKGESIMCNNSLTEPDALTNATPEMNQANAYYKWFYYRNASWYLSDVTSQNFSTVDNAALGDLWVCQITYGDGIYNATPVNTSAGMIVQSGAINSTPNIISLIIRSGNNYLASSPVRSNSSGTQISSYDNSTNVGSTVTFSIDWADADQYNASGEAVKVFLCSAPGMTSGCSVATITTSSAYSSQEPVTFSYSARQTDNTITNFTAYVCDDSGLCSVGISYHILVNHPPVNFSPDLIISSNSTGTNFRCDYEYQYDYNNGSNDMGSPGVQLIQDRAASVQYKWYKYSLSDGNYAELSGENNPVLSAGVTGSDKIRCSIYLTDAYGMSSGELNSTPIDMAVVPVVWDVSSVKFDDAYILRNTNPGSDANISLYGYLPNTTLANLSAASFYNYETPYMTETSSLSRNSSLAGSSAIAIASPRNSSYILISWITALSQKFDQGNFVEISGQKLDYFKRYNITTAPIEVQPGIYKIGISPVLNSSTNVGDTVTAYSGQTAAYPYGWFNVTLGLHNGLNVLRLSANVSGILGSPRTEYVVYDSSTPTASMYIPSPAMSYSPVLYFNISDDYHVNLSTLVLNFTNSTNSVYHFTRDTGLYISNYTNARNPRGSDIICSYTNRTEYSCYVVLNISLVKSVSDNYNATVNVSDLVGRHGNKSTSVTVSRTTIPTPVAFARPVQNATALEFGMAFNLSSASAIEYAVGTAPYPDIGWNSVVIPTNLTDTTSFADMTKFVDYNYNVYYDSDEALVSSPGLNFTSQSMVVKNGTGLKGFVSSSGTNYTYNCSSFTRINSSCLLMLDNDNNGRFNNVSDTILYNGIYNGSSGPVNNDTLTLLPIPLDIKYLDANNNSRYDSGEAVFNSTDSILNSTDTLLMSSTVPSLMLNLSSIDLAAYLSANTIYRISVRYYYNGVASDWVSTNPILYRKGYVTPTFNSPSKVIVYDVDQTNLSNSEEMTGNYIDVALDSKLTFKWSESSPASPSLGETIKYYEYSLGNEPYPYDGWNSVFTWRRTADEGVRQISLNDTDRLSLVTGNMYYLTVRAVSSFGLYSANSSSNGIVYDDQTPPALSIVKVANDSIAPYIVSSNQTSGFNITIHANENLTSCGYSLFLTPFDINNVVTRPCLPVDSQNQSYDVCSITDMALGQVAEGSYTYYISCMDVSRNANPAYGEYSTIAVDFTYDFPNNPTVTWANVSNSALIPSSYAYKNDTLYCIFASYDQEDGYNISYGSSILWQKNGIELPWYETDAHLNLSKYNAVRGDKFSCSVKVKDSTGLWSSVVFSPNITVNNSRPLPAIIQPLSSYYYSNNATFRFGYGSDIDADTLLYYIVIMNGTTGANEGEFYCGGNQTVSCTIGLQNNNISNISDGSHFWTVKTCDNSSASGTNYGNNCTNYTSYGSFYKDTTPPQIMILTPDNASNVGREFLITAKATDYGVGNISVFWLSVNRTNTVNATNITAFMARNSTYESLNGAAYGSYQISGNLTGGNYLITVFANDTLGNIGNFSYSITVDTNKPVLQIDYPPWTFREHFLNHSFNLNLTGYNVSIMRYWIYPLGGGDTIQSNYIKFVQDYLQVNQASYSFNDTVDINSLQDGRYTINFTAYDKLGNYESKTAWFGKDTVPPAYGTAQEATLYNLSTQTISLIWSDNSYLPEDNQFGIRDVWFYFLNTTSSSAPLLNLSRINDTSYVDNATYIVATATVVNSNYSCLVPSAYLHKNANIFWYSCGIDYAGNMACSPSYKIFVRSQAPNINSVIPSMSLYEGIANSSLNLSKYMTDPDGDTLVYSHALLPAGALLYDPLNNLSYTEGLVAGIGSYAGVSTGLRGSIYENATLIDKEYNNLLINPGLESNYLYNDSNGYYTVLAPSGWVLVNNAGYSNDSGAANYTISAGDSAGVNVTARHYFYQDVSVSSGADYSLSMWMRSNSTVTATGRLHVDWYAGTSFISSTMNITANSTTRPSLTGNWERYHAVFRAPSGATKARIFLDSDLNDTWVYIDNIIFEKASYPAFYAQTYHAAGTIKYPIKANQSYIYPYINQSQGTLELTLTPLWNSTELARAGINRTRYIFDTSTQNQSMYAYIDKNSTLYFTYGNKTVSYNASGWTFRSKYWLAFTWNSTNMTFYVNGSASGMNSSAVSAQPVLNQSGFLYLGSDRNATNQLGGLAEELVVFDYAKTASELIRDYNTVPINNQSYTNSSVNSLIYLNITRYENDTNPVITTSSLLIGTMQSISYNQRLQFFGSDGSNYIGSNVLDVQVITPRNTYLNVTLFNTTDSTNGYNYSSSNTTQYVNDSQNSITYSTISHSRLWNMSSGELHFGITISTLVYAIVKNSQLSDTTAQNSTINDSYVSSHSTIVNSYVLNNSNITSSIVNSSTLTNVSLTNSTVINSVLENVILVNGYIDPSIIRRVSGTSYNINDSNITDSILNNSNIVNATVSYSNITNCTIGSAVHAGLSRSYNITSANLTGNSSRGDCRLYDGNVSLNQNTSNFTFSVSQYNIHPLLTDIWNYAPTIQILNYNGAILGNNSVYSGPNFILNASVSDPNIYSSMNDFIDINWTLTYSGTHIYSSQNLNGSNISRNISFNVSGIVPDGASGIGITLRAIDRYGNDVTYALTGINYTVVSYSSCVFNSSLNISHYANATFYLASSGTSCPNVSRRCNNGTWGGDTSYSFTSCTINTTSGQPSGGNTNNGGGGGGGGGSGNARVYCSNGIQDIKKGETGVDCGGSCASCASLCHNGRKDGRESGVDCGGDCKTCGEGQFAGISSLSTTSCFNGKKDASEDGVDCGGACALKCKSAATSDRANEFSGYSTKEEQNTPATCTDGIRNGNEIGVDCGGGCKACSGSNIVGVGGSGLSGVNVLILVLLLLILIAVLVGAGIISKRDKKKFRRLEEEEEELRKKIDEEEQMISSIKSVGHPLNRDSESFGVSGGVAGTSEAGLYARMDAKDSGPISDSVIELEKYIIQCLDGGMKPSAIITLVEAAGWSLPVIEVVMHKIMLSGDKLEEVERFINSQMRKGVPDEAIAARLAAARWSKEIVDLIIADVHRIGANSGSLNQYISKKLSEGKSVQEIHQILVSIGWNEKYIESIFSKYQNRNQKQM